MQSMEHQWKGSTMSEVGVVDKAGRLARGPSSMQGRQGEPAPLPWLHTQGMCPTSPARAMLLLDSAIQVTAGQVGDGCVRSACLSIYWPAEAESRQRGMQAVGLK